MGAVGVGRTVKKGNGAVWSWGVGGEAGEFSLSPKSVTQNGDAGLVTELTVLVLVNENSSLPCQGGQMVASGLSLTD